MHCPACGVEVVEQAVFCHKCGERLLPAENGPPPAEPPHRCGRVPEPAVLLRREAEDEPEQELWRGGYSSQAMTGTWIASGLVSLALLVVGILWGERPPGGLFSWDSCFCLGSTRSQSCVTAA